MSRFVRFVVCLELCACAAAPPPKPAPPPQKFVTTPAASPIDRKTKVLAVLPKVQELLAERAKAFPSLAIGIVVDGELMWSRGYGVRDDDQKGEVTATTVFRVGSLTKLLTGAALLLLRDEGKVAFDAPIVEVLPEMADVSYPTRDSQEITLRHLVTHSSGLPRDPKWDPDQAGVSPTEGDVLSDAASRTLAFAPGTEDAYSNLGVALAGVVVHRASGVPYQTFVSTRLLAPLGMTSTVWDDANVPPGRLALGHRRTGDKLVASPRQWKLGALSPSGGLYSTVEDLAKLAAFELSAWPPRDAPDAGPLRRKTLRESQLTFGPARTGRATFGVGWVIYEEPGVGYTLFHNGATPDYSATMWLTPRRQIGVVAMAGSGDFGLLDQLGLEVLGTLASAVPEPTRPIGPPVAAALERLLKLLDRADEAGVKAAFSERFLKAVPAASVIATLQAIHNDVGGCRATEPITVRSDTEAVVRVSCEKGALQLSIAVGAAEPYLIELLKPSPIE
jgi:CubicO group peptidase (beta-lactamase class C family)